MAGETLLNGRYRLVAQQGSGGMAVIYKAIDQALGRTVAVKILRPSLTSDPAFLTRFRNEARAVANLSHPNIVTVHDVGNEGPTHYIVMEFVDGQDLKKIIRAQGALPVGRALNLAIQICAGIGFAHRAGLVHADVKPQNILVTKDDGVKVTDFGIAQALSDTQPGIQSGKEPVVWGSPHYFAPEQAKGEKPTPASDVYAIGIVLFELLTGRLPYTGSSQQELAMAHVRDAVPVVTEFNPSVPESLARIVQKVMSKEAAARYRMADQLGHVLVSYRDRGQEQTAGGPSVAAAPSPASPPPAPPVTPGQVSGRQPPTPPPATLQPQPRPAQPGLTPTGASEPTQKYGVAPNAPQPVTYRPQGIPSSTRSEQSPVTPLPPVGQQPSLRTDSGRLYAPPAYDQEEEVPPTFDAVTLALAVLAFFAVACLVPLYIAVAQARFGG